MELDPKYKQGIILVLSGIGLLVAAYFGFNLSDFFTSSVPDPVVTEPAPAGLLNYFLLK